MYIVLNNSTDNASVGHETTSGMLSFCVYFLIKHPEVMRKAQAEVDDVLGDQQIQAEDLNKFSYITGNNVLATHWGDM